MIEWGRGRKSKKSHLRNSTQLTYSRFKLRINTRQRSRTLYGGDAAGSCVDCYCSLCKTVITVAWDYGAIRAISPSLRNWRKNPLARIKKKNDSLSWRSRSTAKDRRATRVASVMWHLSDHLPVAASQDVLTPAPSAAARLCSARVSLAQIPLNHPHLCLASCCWEELLHSASGPFSHITECQVGVGGGGGANMQAKLMTVFTSHDALHLFFCFVLVFFGSFPTDQLIKSNAVEVK